MTSNEESNMVNVGLVEAKVPLLEAKNEDETLTRRVWSESKKLWHIAGPAIFSRVATYSMLVITQAFAGHLGDLELAAISISNNVIVGFDFGLLVYIVFKLCVVFLSKWF